MDQQLSERGLSLRPFDPEVFARVWSRVMPDQALSPIQPALPALRSPAQTAPAPSCLGEGSARYVPQLEALMDQLHAALGSVRQLARRGGGRASRLLASLAADQQRQLRRLSAAYFLITGRRYAPKGQGAAPSGPLSSALRTLFQQAQQCAAQAAVLARTVSDDPCLSRLLEDIPGRGPVPRRPDPGPSGRASVKIPLVAGRLLW